MNNWKWFGEAGHFICADMCRFHLHTHVGNYCVSTIGGYYPSNSKFMDKVNLEGYYETMVFKIDENGAWILDDEHINEIERLSYQTQNEADNGHMETCIKYSKFE